MAYEISWVTMATSSGVSDDFNRADGGLGSNWTTEGGTSAPQIVSNRVERNGTSLSAARWTGSTVSSNCDVRFRVSHATGYVVIRSRWTDGNNFLYINSKEDRFDFGSFVGGAWTSTLDNQYYTDEYVRIVANGTSVTMYTSTDGSSWTSRHSFTTTLSGGTPSMEFQATGSGGWADVFSAVDL